MRAAALSLLLLACAGEAPLPLGDGAASCGTCHERHLEQWRTSPHAASADSPILAAMLPDVEASWGLNARQTCEGCHAPAHSSDDGIGCISCHAAVGNQAERDGHLDVDPTVPLAGPFADAEPTTAHRSRASDFLASPSLCGTCHELTGPNIVDEPTLSEYRRSPQAAAGRSCADCHMPDEGPQPIATGGPLRDPSSHRFVGFDPPWGASPEEAADAAERTRALLASALDLRVEPAEGGVTVIVENVGAGHSVPTGATFLRDIWVDLEDASGAIVAPRVMELGDQPMAGDAPVALLTRADRVELGSLPAGEARRVFVETAGPVVARLRGRAIRDEVLRALDIEALRAQIPTHEIAAD